MITTHTIAATRKQISLQKQKGKTIGFVPTMGALHAGHISLVRRSCQECDFTVASIFVNPLQFGPNEDFRKYPRHAQQDKQALEQAGADLLFNPGPKAMYANNHSVYVNETVLSPVLCGRSRPGHFQGVCTVVAKLFNIVQPDIAYFGQKDYQQALIIKRLVQDLNFPITVRIMPIIRDREGLALSSRNAYLSAQERRESLCLSRSLNLARRLIRQGERHAAAIINSMRNVINSKKSARIDYVAVVDAETLRPVEKIRGKVLIAAAVFIGRTRLIDNIIIHEKK